MKYQVGDRIIVLHSNEEGEVVDIINDKMVMIDVQGVKFPAYMDQIDFPYYRQFTQKKPDSFKKERKFIDDIRKEKNPEPRIADGVWLTFLPVMDTDEFGDEYVQLLKLHLLNHTEHALHFTYTLNFFGKKDFDLKNSIQPFEDFYLHDLPFEDMNDNPGFEFDFSLVKPHKKKADHFEASLRLKPKQLFAKINELRQKNLATFSHRLFEIYPDKKEEFEIEVGSLAAKGFKVYDASKVRQHAEPARTVVDLHIEKLTDNWKHMSNYEIVSLQLKTFEKYYELALLHFQPTLIVVHGVGEGKLRDEIHDLLRHRKEVKSFVNQYHPSFGYGATEIYFQY